MPRIAFKCLTAAKLYYTSIVFGGDKSNHSPSKSQQYTALHELLTAQLHWSYKQEKGT